MSELHTNTDTDADKYILNGVEVMTNEVIETITTFLRKQQYRVGRLTARIAELEKDLSNKEIEYTDLWDDALALQSRIAELEAERLELRKILGWAYDLDEYKDNPEERER